MAIPKHVFNILNQNIDLVFSNRLTAKHLIELAIPCQAHGDDILSINQCLNPYCGKRIKNQRQAYYYLSQFKTDHPYAQVSKPFNSDKVEISKYFYNKDADDTNKEASIKHIFLPIGAACVSKHIPYLL